MKDSAMIEFRWVVILALWTLLIGPVVDLKRHSPTAEATREKPAPKIKPLR
jgi:hypothetical protein